ncbi:MAG: N-6 DNA methylase [Cyanobacteria bacterium MAG CAR4_bin_6]|nr:N-6 DNA methylase [Cyanobacteria bacterium MAG CAR4_bin_6]
MLNDRAAATALRSYGEAIQAVRACGNATEHSYRLPLQQLLERMGGELLSVLNEPKQVACGAPDLVVERGGVTVGYVECKDVGTPLDPVEETEQLERYRHGLANLMLTNHLEFRWYLEGQKREKVCLGHLDKRHGIRLSPDTFSGIHALFLNFFSAAPMVIGRSEELAQRMAAKARLLRDAMGHVLEQENGMGPLHDLWQVYRQVLITDLSEADFADLQAQTATYGLFAARCGHPAGIPFTRQSAVFTKTTPFLQDVFGRIAGPGLDPSITWIVDDLARLLDQADMAAVLEDFGQRSQREDPVVHFYEDFLKAYDPKLKEIRGVYYTPEPVVSYIVRSVDKLLRNQFGLPSGLAEMPSLGQKHRVFILDPAVGTGTFLREVIVQIRTTLERQGLAGAWPEYVKQHLLPRLFGFELLMAPYAVAHLKLALELGDQHQGLQLGDGQRLNVFLTNTLEGGHQQVQGVLLAHAIAREAASADGIKREKPVMVVIGNPPYSGHSANKNPWINQLLRGQGDHFSKGSYFHMDGQDLQERNTKWLNDDYVKFIRFAQWRIEKTGEGILAFVTNHSYLDNPTFRGMRRSLMETFDQIYLLDLHGNTRRREQAPDGGRDVNVFDIQQGVAIGFFVKHGKSAHARNLSKGVFHGELWGEREAGPSGDQDGNKYGWLAANDVETTPWTPLAPQAPLYLFVPRNQTINKEYEKYWSIVNIFSSTTTSAATGIVTTHDQLAISWTPEEMIDKMERFLNTTSEKEARRIWRLCSQSQWQYERAKEELASGLWRRQIRSILYRPFDKRITVFNRNVAVNRREHVMRHMFSGANLALCIGRAGQVTGSKQWDVAFVSRNPTDLNLFRRGGNLLFPLYQYLAKEDIQVSSTRKHNLNPDFINASAAALNLTFISDGSGDLMASFGPEDVLHSIYALLHSPAYRQRYQDHLKSDFPSLPIISSKALFADLVDLGRQLVACHCLETETYEEAPTFPHHGDYRIQTVSYTPPQNNHPGQVWINSEQCFHGISPQTWNCAIGGYRPAQKWLKERKGRCLSFADIDHYRHICGALAATSRLMATIDSTIAAHGGWPLAATQS